MVNYWQINTMFGLTSRDSLAEWSKAPDLGSGPKGRGFKSHSCQKNIFLKSFYNFVKDLFLFSKLILFL